jgi:hypothetical protein
MYSEETYFECEMQVAIINLVTWVQTAKVTTLQQDNKYYKSELIRNQQIKEP